MTAQSPCDRVRPGPNLWHIAATVAEPKSTAVEPMSIDLRTVIAPKNELLLRKRTRPLNGSQRILLSETGGREMYCASTGSISMSDWLRSMDFWLARDHTDAVRY